MCGGVEKARARVGLTVGGTTTSTATSTGAGTATTGGGDGIGGGMTILHMPPPSSSPTL